MATLALCLLLPACARRAPEAPSSPMARDQLFFVGQDPDPLLLALVFQRHRRGDGASMEAKAFTAWKGEWVTPFWERVDLDAWPGDGIGPALTAWQGARAATNLRISWSDDDAGLRVKLRGRSAALELAADALPQVATGEGPHGPLSWRAGPAIAQVDGREVRGLLVAERLTEGRVPEPLFGRFEMWLLAPADGGLVLGRRTLSERGSGRALGVGPDGAVTLEAFDPVEVEHRLDAATGFELPIRWRLDGIELGRRDGEAGRGTRPDGGVAVYDVCHARHDDGQPEALVFHLQDQPR